MKNKQLLFLFFFFAFTHISFGQKNIIKGRSLYVPGDPILYYNFGLGYEYLFKEDMSIQLVYNIRGNDMRDNDGDANFKHEMIIDFRYYNLEIKPIQRAIFAFAFFGISQNTNYVIDENDLTGDFENIKKITTERALGVGLGKNFKLGKRFHLEMFVGPKLKSKGIKTILGSNMILTESKIDSVEIGWRAGINLAFQF